MLTSDAGTVQFTPALLTKISSFPPVSADICCLASAMLEALVTSRLMVVMPSSSRSDKTSRSRAVAITCRPRAWNWWAREWPMPPGEQLFFRVS